MSKYYSLQALTTKNKPHKSMTSHFNKLVQACETLCTDLMLPFTDFYMWVRSIIPSLLSVLTVYNAGEYHTKRLHQTFQAHTPTSFTLRNANHVRKARKLDKCLHIVATHSIDDIIARQFSQHAVAAFTTNMKRIHLNIMMLGQLRYLEMLRGKPFTVDELEHIRQDIISTYGHRAPQNIDSFTLSEMIRILHIKPMYIQQEHIGKFTIQ